MMLDIKGHLLSMDTNCQASDRDKALERLESADFRKLLNNPYVTDLGDRVFEFLEKNPNVFKINPEFLQDPKIRSKLSSLIKDLLTAARGNIKPKLWMSIQKKQDISILTKSLIPPRVMEITLAHWARITFMCALLVEFRRIVASQGSSQDTAAAEQQEAGGHNSTTDQSEHRPMTPNSEQDAEETCTPHVWKDEQFWVYVDQLLEELREFAKKGTASTEEWEDNMKDFFTESLQVDMATYAEPGRLVPTVDSVSIEWQRMIHAQLIW
ncbi:hypothetical protein SERLADRAFT_431935 [Serpula lacrymans var. lacrymans S7.9]|uniref:Uncharacterized protein n=1 Tax=Serpula lacrymans var. lacrymans (strain S7.9) TaxID=578457 RepID=F8NDS5_SERL9|nr:uncharacterized protein SERLADRAFT_431935 [Serpula lacrymans var. lacrymans S7.9]EGO30399.1 hypothetical protein SERLADRAFT_431935 [Serpula lacrymans var. lacrymans S7.9]